MAKNVKGTITNKKTGKVISGLTIKVFKDVNDKEKGTATTDEDGFYKISFNLNSDVKIYIKIYFDNFLILKSNSFLIPQQSKTKNFEVEIPNYITGTLLTYDGKISEDPVNSIVNNRKIEVFKKGFGTETYLNSGLSDPKGFFKIYYLKGETKRIDVLVKVYDIDNNNIEFISDVIIGARRYEIVDFLVTGEKYIGLPKLDDTFNKINNTVNSATNLSQLTDDDLKILSLDSKVDEDSAKKFIRAKQLISEMQVNNPIITEEILFGLMKKNISVEPAKMLMLDKDILYNNIISAVDSNIINSGEDAKNNISKEQWAENVVVELKKLAINLAKNKDKREIGKFTIFNIVQDIPTEKIDPFLNEYVLNTKADFEFWENIKNKNILSLSEIENLKFNFDLSILSEQHEITYTLIHTYSKDNNLKTLKDLAKSNIDWFAIISNISEDDITPEIKGNSLSEKQKKYAKKIEDKIAQIFPSEVIISYIKNSKDASLEKLKVFFESFPNFNFSETTIDAYFINEQNRDIDNIGEITKEKLKRAQRLFNILPKNDKKRVFNILWINNIKSAHQIVALGKNEFEQLFDNTEVSPNSISELFKNAQNKNSKVTSIFLQYNNVYSNQITNVLPSREKNKANNPDLETLFSSFDYCDCKDCQSTLSASAYLTDNLAFLQKIKTDDNKTVFEKLIQRRPDIQKILLNCKNTDTPIPYIDIINEVLEDAISPYMLPNNYPQTNLNSDDIDANPEYFNIPAYEKLQNSKSPISLPYNYWFNEAQEFISHFNISLNNIIELFPEKTNSLLYEALSYLGISVEEKNFLIGTYSYSENNVINILKDTQLDFNTFTELLKSKYINPNNNDILFPDSKNCSLENATIDINTKKLFDFKRLLNITNWTKEELDIFMIKYPIINDDFIIQLYYVKKLQDYLNISINELLVFWDKIDTLTNIESENDFYTTKFLSKAISNENKEIFKLDSNGEIIDKDNKPIKENIITISAALGLPEEDIIDVIEINDILDINNLSYLNRLSVFSNSVGIRPKEIIILSNISGMKAVNVKDNSDNVTPHDTLEFISILKKIQNSGFTINDLNYLLNNNIDSNSILIKEHKEQKVFLQNLQSDLFELVKDYNNEKYDKESLITNVLKSIKIPEDVINNTLRVIYNTYDISNSNTTKDFINEQKKIFKGQDPVVNLVGENQILEVDERFKYVLNGLLQDVYNFIFNEKIISNFSIEFDLDLDFTNKIIDNFIKINQISALNIFSNISFLEYDFNNEPKQSVYYDIYEILNKASAFIKKYNINLIKYEASKSIPDIIDIFNITSEFNKWENLDSIYYLQNKYFNKSDYLIFDFFSASFSYKKIKLLEITSWNEDDFDFIIAGDNITVELLFKVSKSLDISNKIGVSIETMSNWVNISNIKNSSKEIKSAVKAKYNIDTWKTIATPIMKVLREKRRDALSSYLINYGFNSKTFENKNDLYEYFLLDTQMSACSKTSRIVLANSVMQLFVQRIQMNLEGNSIILNNKQAKEWEWRKKYRVWEANRRVFLYPENWLEPELRDDKSTFFEEMQEELLQVDLDTKSAETIFKNYLEKFETISKLEIAQQYYDEDTNELHVFARTFGSPNVHYYRKRTKLNRWTSWQKIDLDISSKIIIPVVHNNSLFLFWTKLVPVKNLTNKKNQEKIFDIHFMWSEYKNNNWTAGKMSDAKLMNINQKFAERMYFFVKENTEDEIIIGNAYSFNIASYNRYDFGNFGDLTDYNKIIYFKFNIYEKTFEPYFDFPFLVHNTFLNNNPANCFKDGKYRFYYENNNSFIIPYKGDVFQGLIRSKRINDKITAKYGNRWDDSCENFETSNLFSLNRNIRITLPHQERFYKSKYPFFIEDENRVFLVVPKENYIYQNESAQTKAATIETNICQVNALRSVISNSIPVYNSNINFTNSKISNK